MRFAKQLPKFQLNTSNIWITLVNVLIITRELNFAWAHTKLQPQKIIVGKVWNLKHPQFSLLLMSATQWWKKESSKWFVPTWKKCWKICPVICIVIRQVFCIFYHRWRCCRINIFQNKTIEKNWFRIWYSAFSAFLNLALASLAGSDESEPSWLEP